MYFGRAFKKHAGCLLRECQSRERYLEILFEKVKISRFI